VYEKSDNQERQTSLLSIHHAVFVESQRTGDFQTTSGLIRILENDGNLDDILAFFEERRLPVDDVQAEKISKRNYGESATNWLFNNFQRIAMETPIRPCDTVSGSGLRN